MTAEHVCLCDPPCQPPEPDARLARCQDLAREVYGAGSHIRVWRGGAAWVGPRYTDGGYPICVHAKNEALAIAALEAALSALAAGSKA